MGSARLFPAWVVVAGVVVLAGGRPDRLAAQVRAAGARPEASAEAGRVRSAVPSPAIVPAGEPEAATSWLATTDGRLSVLFSYHREEAGCAGRCERYGLWLRYREPSGGAPAASRAWDAVSAADCVDFWVDGAQDLACVSTEGLAGRDRRGNDYVLLPLYASRAQLERMLASRTLVFQLGGVGFHLLPPARDSLRSFLASAGRAVAR